jgi:hypothetical protein
MWHVYRLTVRHMSVCKWSDTRGDWRLDMCVYVNEVTRVHIGGWICVYVYEITHVEIDG